MAAWGQPATNPLACPRSGLPSTADLRRYEKHFPCAPGALLCAPTPPALDLGGRNNDVGAGDGWLGRCARERRGGCR